MAGVKAGEKVVTGKIGEEGVGKEPGEVVVSEKVSGADEPLDMVLSTDNVTMRGHNWGPTLQSPQ